MAKVVWWSQDQAQKELERRLRFAKRYRRRFEYQWEQNEQVVYNTRGYSATPQARYSFESDLELGLGDVDSGSGEIGINYTFKHLRFLHAQLSANPPTVVARPTSSDNDDRRRADAADRLVRHAIRQYELQEVFDKASLHTVLYGTGWVKTSWNPDLGEIDDFDPESGEISMEGDIEVKPVSTWNVFVDPDAHEWKDCRYVFQRTLLPLEEAQFRWPEKAELLEKAKSRNYEHDAFEPGRRDEADLYSETVEIYEYFEKGLPINGMVGRYAILLDDGSLLEEVRANPFKFSPTRDKDDLGDKDPERPRPETAKLPFHIFTDIDMPGQIFGKSFIDYESAIQDTINRLDSVTLDNVQAHMVARLVLPEGAEVADDSITNSPWDMVKITGTQPPHFMEVPQIMPDATSFRDRLQAGGDDMAGINDSMMGKIERETSGFSLQYATNQGNMIRRRLFNKYVMFVEGVFKGFLNLVRKHWSEDHTVYVLGTEKAFQSIDLKGADIDGGFDLVVEYGASLSLDPQTRREEIMQLMPVFEKAGVDTKTILSMLKLNELESLYDLLELARDRQKEIFDEMVAKNIYIQPEELQEHKAMLDFAYRFIMTTEFKYMEEEPKELIRKHIKERETLAAQGAGGQPPAGAPGPAGQPGPVPQGPEMAEEQAPAPQLAPPVG